jgi:hypothetical protein
VAASLILFLACGYVVVLLGVAGAAHIVRLTSFMQTVQTHGIIPPLFASAIAVVVALVEVLCAGALAGAVILGGRTAALFCFSACGILGVMFLAYLATLLKRSTGGSCGCLPVDSPVTGISMIPAAGIVLFCALGALARMTDPSPSLMASGLGLAWGVMYSLLAVLLAASMPGPEASATLERS